MPEPHLLCVFASTCTCRCVKPHECWGQMSTSSASLFLSLRHLFYLTFRFPGIFSSTFYLIVGAPGSYGFWDHMSYPACMATTIIHWTISSALTILSSHLSVCVCLCFYLCLSGGFETWVLLAQAGFELTASLLPHPFMLQSHKCELPCSGCHYTFNFCLLIWMVKFESWVNKAPPHPTPAPVSSCAPVI